MILYTVAFYIRVFLDLGSLIRMKLLNSTDSLLLSPSKFAFSVPMIGIRPFLQILMSCEDQESYQAHGYCPDQFMVNGEPFSPFPIYIFVSVFEILIGLILLYKAKLIYVDEFVPLGLHS